METITEKTLEEEKEKETEQAKIRQEPEKPIYIKVVIDGFIQCITEEEFGNLFLHGSERDMFR